MSRTDPQMKVRLPEDLHARVVQAARANKRSLNAEIVAALEEKYPVPITIEVIDIIKDGGDAMESKDDERVRLGLELLRHYMEQNPKMFPKG